MSSILPYHPGIRKAANHLQETRASVDRPSAAWEEPFRFPPLSGQAAQSISLKEDVRCTLLTEESSMSKRTEVYRYELQHGDDADFVAYQRQSRDGAWRTVSIWMIP